jgi:hypothetical protein
MYYDNKFSITTYPYHLPVYLIYLSRENYGIDKVAYNVIIYL